MIGFSSAQVAVAGCGYWGKNLVRNMASLGALSAVCDADAALAEGFAGQFGVPAVTWQTLLADPAIEGVVIAAPAVRHAIMAQEALVAGKHVFVEKPLALSVADAERLCHIADDRSLVLMVGHLLQYHPAFERLKEIVGNGELGRLQYVYSNRLNLGKFRREENILWSFAPHDISMILSLINEDPDTVYAAGSSYLHARTADVTTTHLSFPGGQAAHIHVSWLHPFKEQKLVVIGDRAMAVFDDGEPWVRKLQLYRHEIGWKEGFPQPEKADAVSVEVAEDEPLKIECQHFLDCIRNGSRPRTDGTEGTRVLRVLQAAEESMTLGRPVQPGGERLPEKTVEIHETACVDEPCEIGEGTRIWHFSHILRNSQIGRDCVIGQNVMIGPDAVIGDNCKVQNNVSVYKGVTLEDGVFCGPSAVFTNVVNPRATVDRKAEFKPTLVRRGATIGANATILCGTVLGEYCFIAAGAVVIRDVPAHALMAGVPARRIGWVSHHGESLGPDLVCPATGQHYRESGAGLEPVESRSANS